MASGLNAGEIGVRLSLDAKPLQEGAKKAEQTLDSLGKSVEAIGKDAEESFSRASQATTQFGGRGARVAEDLSQSFFGLEAKIKGVETATDRYKREMEGLSPAVSKAKRSLDEVGSSMSAIGQKMSIAVTLPLVTTGTAAIKLANDFEFAMASIEGLVGIAGDKVDQMTGKVRSMAMEFGQSAPNAAKALYFVTSAGIDGATAMDVLESSLKASAIGMGETMVVADTVSSALNAYGSANLSAAEASDVMVAAVRRGKMEADALAGALPQVLPIASSMGVSFQEVGAAFAAMSLNGTDASEAATQIRGILASLLNPTKQAEEQLNALGLSGAGLRQTIREDGLLAGLELLTQAFGNNEEAAGVVFGNIRALTGVMSLFGSATEGTKDIFADLADNTGEVDKAFNVLSNTGAFKVSQAMASIKDAMISFGQALIPIVVPILKTVTGLFAKVASAVSSLPGPIRTAIVVFGLLAAAAGPVLIALGSLVRAYGAVKAAALAASGAQGVQSLTSGIKGLAGALSNPYVLGAAAVAIGIGIAWKTFSDNAREARERQERLTEALTAANDPTWTLVNSVRELGDAYADAANRGENLAPAAMSANATFVAGELAANNLDTVVSNLGISMEDLASVVATGTDQFDWFDRKLRDNGNGVNGFKDILDLAVGSNLAFADAMREAYYAGELSQPAIEDLIELIDKMADAFDDNNEAANSAAQELLFSGTSLDRYNSILGDSYVRIRDQAIATAEAAGSQYVYTDALASVESTVARVEYAQARIAGELDNTTASTKETIAATKTLDETLRDLRATAENGQVTFADLANKIGIVGDVLANNLQLMLIDTQAKANSLFDDLADGNTTFTDVEVATRNAANQIGQLIVDTANLGGTTQDAIPSIVRIMSALYDGAEAAGVSKDKVANLIKEIGFLDKLSPEIALALTLDTSAIEAQIQKLVNQLQGAGGRNSAILQQIDELGTMLKAIRDISAEGPRQPSRGGGGGGGGAQQDQFAWVDKWLADISKYVKDVASKDFADQLIKSSAPEIGKALERVVEEAVRLGVDRLDASGALGGLIKGISDQLQGLANQLEGADGLRQQLAKANSEVSRLEDNFNNLKQALADFKRVAAGKLTTLEKLDEALSKYSELKSSLEGLKDAYDQFQNAGTDPLERELGTLDELNSKLSDLEETYKSLDQYRGNTDPLERERTKLDDLSRSLENLKQAKIDYQKSTTESLANVQFQARGGVLGQAKRYLAKASTFRDIIMGLRDREFPVAIIKDVINAGLDGGTALGRKLLSLSDADLKELKSVQEQIAGVAATTGEVAADVLFTADISEADNAFRNQLSLVRQMYEKAMADSRAEYEAQRKVVEGVYEQQIKNAENLLSQQAQVVEALYKSAISDAKKQLTDAQKVAEDLGDKVSGLEDAMRDLIKAIADAVKQAGSAKSTSPTAPSTGGGGDWVGRPTPDGGADFTNPRGDKIHLPPGLDFSGFGKRAMGGSVMAGKPYLVGEVGAELFVPGRSGTIIPNSLMGGGSSTVNNYTINVQGGGADVGRQVVKAIQEYERRNGNGWRA